MELKTRLEGGGEVDHPKDQDDSSKKTGETFNKGPDYIPLAIKIFTPLEIEFKQSIHTKLLDTLDLSMISGLNDQDARQQIRKATQRLIDEQAIPLNNRIAEKIMFQFVFLLCK